MKKNTKRQLDKLDIRVNRIFDRYPSKVKRMVFDGEGNLYGETVKNAPLVNDLNIAYYVVLGKRIYIMTLNDDFTRSYLVMLYKKSIFNYEKIDIKIYDDEETLGTIFTDLFSVIEFARVGFPNKRD